MRRKSRILSAVLLICLCAALTGCSALSWPDQFVLQDHVYPQYARYLQGNVFLTYNINRKQYKSENITNILHLQVYSDDDSTMSRHLNYNGSVTLKGESDRNTYIRMTDNFTLDPGTYRIYDGKVSDGENICMFVNGYDEDGNSTRVAQLPDDGTFEVEEGGYSYYRLYVFVAAGYEIEQRTIFPMLCDADTEVSSYSAPVFSTASLSAADTGNGQYYPFMVFNITKEELATIPYEDLQVFLRNLRYIYKKTYLSCTIDFGDGTGVQFRNCNPDKGVYGELDAWYRVPEEEAAVTDTGEYLTLTDSGGSPVSGDTEAYGINGIHW